MRRLGAVSDLLFLYECATQEISQLRPIAERLGLTVQAASHTFRGLARRGLAEQRGGRYRPTVAGVDWLHSTLDGLHTDLGRRLEELPIVRSARAVARGAIPRGAPVVLSLEDGVLTARRGLSGPSRGVAGSAARPGDLLEVDRLQGIVPLRRGAVTLWTLPSDQINDPVLARRLAGELRRNRHGLLAAQGLEAYHLVRRAAPQRPVVRFGIAGAVEEATRLGVDCAVVVLDREAPRLRQQFSGSDPPRTDVVTLARSSGSPRRVR